MLHPTVSISHTRRLRHPGAFTLIELLMVIVILGVMAAVTFPSFRNTFDDLTLQTFVKRLYFLETYLHESAIVRGTTYCLAIDSDKEPIEIRAFSHVEGGAGEKLEGRFGRVYKIPRDITLVAIEPTEKNSICFYPDGSADFSKITFENNRKKVIFLAVDEVSGAAQIQ